MTASFSAAWSFQETTPSRSPFKGVAPRDTRDSSFSGLWTSPVTWWPALARIPTSSLPIYPVLPVTKIFILCLLRGCLEWAYDEVGTGKKSMSSGNETKDNGEGCLGL